MTSKILEINSSTNELGKVSLFLEEFLHNNRLNINDFNRIYLCLSEAVINAIIHGNKGKEKKIISIELSYYKPFLNVKVVDEGCGFNFTDIPDPTKADNLLKENGRGLFIIKCYSENLSVLDCGNSIVFKMLLNEQS